MEDVIAGSAAGRFADVGDGLAAGVVKRWMAMAGPGLVAGRPDDEQATRRVAVDDVDIALTHREPRLGIGESAVGG